MRNVTLESVTVALLFNAVGNPNLLSILGAHLLFSMKEAGEKGLNQGTNCGAESSVSGLEFGVPSGAAGESSLATLEGGNGSDIVMPSVDAGNDTRDVGEPEPINTADV